MADSLNLATLNVAVQATGVQQTQAQVDNLTSSVQRSGNTTSQSTSRMRGAFSNLGSTISETVGQAQIFGTSLSDIGGAFNSAGGMASLLQGAVMGVTSALVQMATQAIQNAIAGIGQFISKGVELASDLTEIQNVLDAAFGDGAEQVNEWAVTTASAFGLTELQAKQYSSTLGAIFSGMNITGSQAMTMSEQMAQLTGDMASFYNLDHDVAFEKIKSGLTGETEPLKALGIVMNETNLSAFAMQEGIEKSYSAMSESEKVILRYNYLINQTSLAHGDFAKTQDSYSNVSASLENNMSALSATLGAQLLPVLTSIKVAFNGLLEKLSPITELIGKLVGGMLTTLVNMVTPVVEVIKVLLAVLNPVIEVLNDILDVVISIVSKIGTGLTTVVSVVAEKLGLVQKNVGDVAEYTTEEIKEQTEKALGYVTTATQKWIDEQMDDYEDKLRKRYGDSGSLANEIKIQEALEKRHKSLNEVAETTMRAYENAEAKKQEAINKTNEAIEKQIELTKKQTSNSGASYVNGVRQYATGTSYHPGGLAMVGENGRELINLPRGSSVMTNRETENFMRGSGGGGDTYIVENVSINASSIQDISDIKNVFDTYKQTVRMGV